MSEHLDYEMLLHPSGYCSTRTSPAVELLSHCYANLYFQKPEVAYSSSYKQNNHHQILKDEMKLIAAKQLLSQKHESGKLSAIEIGCGEGFFLELMQQNGFDNATCWVFRRPQFK